MAASKYAKALQGIDGVITPGCFCDCSIENKEKCNLHVYHQYTLKIINADRDALAAHLNKNGIPCGVYYPIPLHLQKAYVDDRYKEENFKVTNQLIKEVISLPMHTELEDEQIDFITSTVIDFLKNN